MAKYVWVGGGDWLKKESINETDRRSTEWPFFKMLVNLRTKCFNIKTLGLKMKWVEKSVTKNLNFLIINFCLHFFKLFLPLVSGKTVYGNFV